MRHIIDLSNAKVIIQTDYSPIINILQELSITFYQKNDES